MTGHRSPRRRRAARWIGFALVAVTASLTALPTPGLAAPTPIMFGAYVGPTNGQSLRQAIAGYESMLGDTLAAVRVYDLWNQPLSDADTRGLRDSGHTLFVSVKAKRLNGTIVPWRTIADAQPGTTMYSEIAGWADAVKGFGAHVYFTFNHEPEASTNKNNGTNVDFIDAWRKVVTVFRDRNVTNATFLWIMTDYSFWVTDNRSAPRWYPGDAYVDAIGADSYNWYNCRPGINNAWKSLQAIIEPLRQFGLQHPGKPLFLPEFASVEDPNSAGRKASWVDAVTALFQKPGWEQFRGILYYDAHDKNNAECLWDVDSSTSSLNAVRRLAADPYFQGTDGIDPPPPPPPPPPSDVFSDGFESGNLSAWSATTRATVQSATVATGTHALRLNAPGSPAFVNRNLGVDLTDVTATARFHVISQGSNNMNLEKLQGAGGTPIVTLALTPSGNLILRNDQSGVTTWSPLVPAKGAWHLVKVHLVVAGGSSSVAVTVDGTAVPALTMGLTLGSTPVSRLVIGDSSSGRTFDLAADDVAVTTA